MEWAGEERGERGGETAIGNVKSSVMHQNCGETAEILSDFSLLSYLQTYPMQLQSVNNTVQKKPLPGLT